MVYRSVSELDFKLDNLPPLPRPTRVMMTTPDYFDVLYVINPHMKGQIGCVSPQVAFG